MGTSVKGTTRQNRLGRQVTAVPGALARRPAAAPAWLRRQPYLLVGTDLAAGLLAVWLTYAWVPGVDDPYFLARDWRVPTSLAVLGTLPLWFSALTLSQCYNVGPFGVVASEVRHVVRAGVRLLSLMAVAYYVIHLEQLGRDPLIGVIAWAAALTLLGRGGLRWHVHLRRRRGHLRRKTLLVGSHDARDTLRDHLDQHPELEVVDEVASEPLNGSNGSGNVQPPVADQVIAHLAVSTADLVVVAGGGMLSPELRRLCWDLEGSGIDVLVAPAAGIDRQLHVRPVAGLPLLYLEAGPPDPNRVLGGSTT